MDETETATEEKIAGKTEQSFYELLPNCSPAFHKGVRLTPGAVVLLTPPEALIHGIKLKYIEGKKTVEPEPFLQDQDDPLY